MSKLSFLGPSSIRDDQFRTFCIVFATDTLAVTFFFHLWTESFTLRFGYSPEDVTDFTQKLQFTLKYFILPISWIAINIFMVMLVRFRTEAINPLTNNEHLTYKMNKILTNSCEQALLSLVTQLIVIDYLSPNKVLQMIPGINFMFVLGRILFVLGYPYYRAIGFELTFTTNVVILIMIWFHIFWSFWSN